MRLIKSMHLGYLSRCFEFERKFFLNVSTMVGFRFDGSVRLISELALWPLAATELGADGVLDEALPKSRAEFFVKGKVFCPGGQPQVTCPVKVKVGAVEKTLYVIGDRVWQSGVPSPPAPFTSMDLGWERAYGGPGYARNPVGKGFAPIEGADGKEVHPLPNVEVPQGLITSPREKKEPAGFLPWGMGWPQRAEKLGSYDEKWLKEDYPGYPRDIDWSAFNLAWEDQQQVTPWVGDEEIVCTNLHPDKPELKGRLPGIQTRAFVAFKGAKDSPLIEVPMRATTLWLFPHIETGVLISHGTTQVSEDDAFDVEDVLVAAENLGQPRTVAHYQEVRAITKRAELDSVMPTLEGTGLVPEGCEGIGEMSAEVKALTPENLAVVARSQHAAERHAGAVAKLEAAGMDASILGPPPPPMESKLPDIGQIDVLLKEAEKKIEGAKILAAEQKAKADADARRHLEEQGLDPELYLARDPGPPTFSAEREIAQTEGTLANARMMGRPLPELEAVVADPEYRARLERTETHIYATYLRAAHQLEARKISLGETEAAARKQRLLDRVRSGQSVARLDFTGVDVAGEDLSGADLSGGFFEQANFHGCNLARANLSSTVLVGVDLAGADLSGTNLEKANLGRANLAGVRASETPNFADTTLDGIDLTEASLPGIVLHAVDLRDAKLDRVDLSRGRFTKCTFIKCSMQGADFHHATLSESSLMECNARGMIATSGVLDSLSIHDTAADDAKLDHAHALSLRVTGKSTVTRIDVTESMLEKSNFREMDLSGAVFTRARLLRADLSEARLCHANLDGIVAREAMFIRTDFSHASLVRADLMSALLTKANFTQADLTDASLFGADLARARSDGGTKLEGVDQTRARIHPTLPPRVET